jgi:hypothetical protein
VPDVLRLAIVKGGVSATIVSGSVGCTHDEVGRDAGVIGPYPDSASTTDGAIHDAGTDVELADAAPPDAPVDALPDAFG